MNTTGSLFSFWEGAEEWSEAIQLDQEYFPRPWKEQDWKDLNPQHHILLGWKNSSNEFLGFSLFAGLPLDETAHLLKIIVKPELQGTGVASEFWQNIETFLKTKQIEQVFLEVEENNLRAQGFYQKLGFKLLRVMRSYYSDGANCYSMLLTL